MADLKMNVAINQLAKQTKDNDKELSSMVVFCLSKDKKECGFMYAGDHITTMEFINYIDKCYGNKCIEKIAETQNIEITTTEKDENKVV